ncbi:MAG: hypothetical protein DRI24_23675 [Deltaproteobacteria bacterium]|nr:MAG: hypothetical protein DRI24_23675 [Deltaproteobacteria bacterium]
MTIYCIEGPDCCGKTTLANAMAKKLDAAIFHHTYIKGWTKADLLNHFQQGMNHMKAANIYSNDLILDRGWISTAIYGDIYRYNPLEIDTPVWQHMYKDMGVKYIMCHTEYNEWQARYKESKDEMYEMDENMHKIYEWYYGYWSGSFVGGVNTNKHLDKISEAGGFKRVLNMPLFDYTRKNTEEFLVEYLI